MWAIFKEIVFPFHVYGLEKLTGPSSRPPPPPPPLSNAVCHPQTVDNWALLNIIQKASTWESTVSKEFGPEEKGRLHPNFY